MAFLTIALALLLPTNPTSLVATGDTEFFRIDYPAAITAYESALRDRPDDPEILWRLARVYVCTGEVADEQHRISFFNVAETYARRCIRVDSTKGEGHTWLAGALGYTALERGVSEQVVLSHELVREVSRALALNPNDDIAYSIKGSFYRALGNVGWLQRQLAKLFVGSIPDGGYEESEEALKRAVSLAPDVMRHQYELGILYIDMDRKTEARQTLEQAAALPVRTAIDRPRLAKIHELLTDLRSPGR